MEKELRKMAEAVPVAAPAPEPEPKDKPELLACENCGWVSGAPEPREADKTEYLRAVLGGRRFTKTYMPWDGQLTLKFRSMTGNESEFINQVLSKNVFVNDVSLGDAATKAKLLFQLTSLNTTDIAKVFEPVADTDHSIIFIQDEFRKRFGEFDETILRVIAKTLQNFNLLLQLLVISAFDRNFYKAAGPL
jgi:hypothetical protein